MTDLLKQLMANYGQLIMTLAQLEKERPGAALDTLADYHKSLGPAEPGEPILAVRISDDGKTRFLEGPAAAAAAAAIPLPQAYEQGSATVLELPKDEFYFFQAFRQTAFDLESALPPFLFEISFVYAYTLFETYLADLIRLRLSDRESSRLMREPIGSILEKLRHQYGFGDLSAQFDREVVELSLKRNCLVHNASRADPKLVAAQPSFTLGQPISVNRHTLSGAIQVYRSLAVALDSFAETADPQSETTRA